MRVTRRDVQVPSKMRLVVLAGLLRQICAAQRAAKVVLFMSSCDAVEFVHQMFSEVFELVDGTPLLPSPIYKLHGNLAQVYPLLATSQSGTSGP